MSTRKNAHYPELIKGASIDRCWGESEYPGYLVSNYGDVIGISGKLLTGRLNADGYRVVEVYTAGDGTRRTAKVHRLVAYTFLGPSGLEVNHKDGNKTNNHVSNLEYCTRRENIIHGYMNGLYLQKIGVKETYEIRKRLAAGEYQKDIAKDYGVSNTTISNINTGKVKSYIMGQVS